MATAKFYVPTDSLGATLFGAFDTAEVLSYSSSEIRLGVPGGATLVVIYGQFQFTPDGDLIGGTLTGLTTYLADGIRLEMVLSGMNVDLLALVDLATSGTEDDLGNLLFGGADLFTGSPGADLLPSYNGNDTIDGGAGVDTMEGGNGWDTYFVREVGDLVIETNSSSASGGFDTVQSYLGNYTLPANVENGRIMISGAAKLVGNSLANALTGGSGADTLVGGAGNDLIAGGSGDDTADYTSAPSAVKVNLSLTGAQVTGGAGTDTLSSIERLTGSNYADQLTGNGSANRLTGGEGNDTLDGGAGNDVLTGGNGADTYHLRDAGDSVSETNPDSSGGVDTVLSYLSTHTLGTNIENGRIMSSGTASLVGNGLNNLLYAGSGNNTLNGSTGTDTASYTTSGAAVVVSLALTTGQATGGSGTDTLISIEKLIGSPYADQLSGNSVANTLTGGAGNDTLDGGPGNDTMIGGDGSDTYRLRDVGDVVSETNASVPSGGSDTVLSYLTSLTLSSNLENGRIMSAGTASLTGNGLNNQLYPGSGNNLINGGSGIDTANYGGASAAVKVSLAVTTGQATGGSGTDTLAGIENLIGSAYNDTLTGSSGGNVLKGGLGSDLLNGGSGNDQLTGGDGADVFRLDSTPNASGNIDTLADFRGVDDAIQLENSVFTKLATTGTLTAANFAANTNGRAVDGNDFVVYETDTGKLLYDADGSGPGAAVQIALLTGMPVLSNLDIFVT